MESNEFEFPSIGIDLGTTCSGVSVYQNGKCEMIPNKEGSYLTESYVYYDIDSPQVFVGSTAIDKGVAHITNCIFGKLLLLHFYLI